MLIGKYLTLGELSTCSQTYQKYAAQIDPYPKNPETITAWQNLTHFIIDPIIDNFGREKFQLTYGSEKTSPKKRPNHRLKKRENRSQSRSTLRPRN
jgi:hypothetical protein